MPQLSKIISTSKSDMWAVNQGESVVIIVYVLHLVMQKPSISLKKYNSLFFQCWNFASIAVNIDNRYTSILNALLNVLRNQYLNLWNLLYTCNMSLWRTALRLCCGLYAGVQARTLAYPGMVSSWVPLFSFFFSLYCVFCQ